jgi:hypothetical protein
MNPKAKGSAFERQICAKLSLWVSGGTNKDLYWRSSMSGGRATIHVGKGRVNRQAGDICAVAPEGHTLTDQFFIECKAVRDLNLTGFVLSNVGPLAKYWTICVTQAATHKRSPLLIAKQNNHPIMVVSILDAFTVVPDRVEFHRPGDRAYQLCRFDDLMQRPFQVSINGRHHNAKTNEGRCIN